MKPITQFLESSRLNNGVFELSSADEQNPSDISSLKEQETVESPSINSDNSGPDHLLELDDPKSVELSQEFIGRWSRLISTTNWEKGRIISEWREALMGSEAPATAYSDEAWCRRVGGVSSQHVGRLRRVFDRFGSSYETYAGLFWSHFLAALDWDDAEMWLEGAAQSKWSVSQMRRTRWEAMGGDPSNEPNESEVISASEDEDFVPLAEVEAEADAADGTRSVAEGPRPDGPDFGDADEAPVSGESSDGEQPEWEDEGIGEPEESPFATLPSLPVDLTEAVEQFKLAIIRHRASEWSEVSKNDVQKSLDALSRFLMQ